MVPNSIPNSIFFDKNKDKNSNDLCCMLIFFFHRFGVCCVFMLSECGVQVTENCTYIRNPGFPEASTDITTCKFTVQKCDTGIAFLHQDSL